MTIDTAVEENTVRLERPDWGGSITAPNCLHIGDPLGPPHPTTPGVPHVFEPNLPPWWKTITDTEITVTDPNTGGQKGTKPERFDLIPFEGLEEVARVFAFGARKYDDHNWRKGYKWSLGVGALLRHVSRWMCGETRDRESGLHHLAHAAFHCLTLVTFDKLGLGTDDRPPRGPSS